MKKCILLIFSMLICSTLSVAQVREFNIDAQSNSIVRFVRGDSVLIYVEKSPELAYFMLYVEGCPLAKAFQLLAVYKMQVRDVKIHDGKVAYFCGTMTMGSEPQALIGQFDIADVFNGYSGVNYAAFQWTTPWYMFLATDLTRLELFECHDTVCMAMTGHSLYDFSIMYPNTTVASAYYYGGQWNLCAHLNKLEYLRFTDVTCLDNVVMAVGTTNVDTGCYMKTFYKTPDFPMHPCVAGQTAGVSYGRPVGETLVDHVNGDTAVMVYFDNSSGLSTVFHQVVVSATGVPQTPLRTYETTPVPSAVYGTGQDLLELNSYGHKTYLLHRSEYPTTLFSSLNDWVMTVNYSLYPPPMGAAIYEPFYMWHPLHGVQHSMDAGLSLVRLSGHEGDNLVTYNPPAFATGSCYYKDSVDNRYTKAGVHTGFILEDALTPNAMNTMDFPVIIDVNIETICDLRRKEQEQ